MKALKYDNRIHYESDLELISKKQDYIVLHGNPERKLLHYTRDKTFTFHEHSLEIFFKNRWYTVACSFDNDGAIKSYYCNIAMPCKINKKYVSFVDLDLDVIMKSDLNYEVVDREEFNEHMIKYSYPEELINKTNSSLKTLIFDIENKNFPFNGFIQKKIQSILNT